jgi:hypothetical protein
MINGMAKETSSLEIVTLVVAILGVLLALASLVWQAATFVLSGSRVRLLLRQGALKRMAGGTVRISGPLQPTASDCEVMRSQGFEEPVLIVEVRNRGRMAVSVEDIAAVSEDGWGFKRAEDPENPSLPHRLEPGAKQAWHVELAVFQALVDKDRKPRKAWMTVELGTGRVMRTKQSTLVSPSATPDAS